MSAFIRGVLVVLVALVLPTVATGAESSLTKRDAGGPVTVVVTLNAAPVVGAPLTAKVALDTHSVGLESVQFEQAVVLRTSDDRAITPRVETVTGSGHHRQAVLLFPALASAGPVRLVVKNVGGVAERTFIWEAARR